MPIVAPLRRPAAVAVAALLLLAGLVLAAPRADAAGLHARTATEKAMISRVVAQINAYRKTNGRAALKLNPQLSNSARLHDYRMTAAQTLSHRLPGEPDLGTRATKAGYSWHTVGENIGWTSPRTTAGLLQILAQMYAEGPGGGHYENFVDRGFADVGVDVYGDAAHDKLWVTMDFGHH